MGMCYCQLPKRQYKEHYACFICRKMFRQVGEQERKDRFAPDKKRVVKCPQCAQPMRNIGRFFQPPKSSNIKQWRLNELLWLRGFRWYHSERPVVRTLREVNQYIHSWEERQCLKREYERKRMKEAARSAKCSHQTNSNRNPDANVTSHNVDTP